MFGSHLYYSSINPQPKQNRFFYKIYGVMHVGERIRFLHFIKLIKQKINSPMEILDAGTGNGNYAFYLRKLFPEARIVGRDISREKVNHASELAHFLRLENISFHQESLTNVKEKGKYDVVICIDVLEHIKNDSLVLRNIGNSLKAEGRFILHVPKDRRLARRHFRRFKGFSVEDHVREEYRIEEILHKIKKASLKVESFSHTQGWFGSLAWEIDQLLILYFSKLRYALFPLLYVLILADVYWKNKNGNGFLFFCVKE